MRTDPSKRRSLDLGSLTSHNDDDFLYSVTSKMRFSGTQGLFLAHVEKILLSQALGRQLEMQFPLPERTNCSGVKPLDEHNSSIAMELGIPLATTAKVYLLHCLRDGFQIYTRAAGRIVISL